jgi:protoporphyrinogen oxidase
MENEDNSGRHWIYFPEKEICFSRVGFPHNFSSLILPKSKSSLYIEVAYSKNKPIDKSKIILRIKKDLKKLGILKKEDHICCQDINDIKYGYPIYDLHYNVTRKLILNYLIHKNILSCGRYGSWRYLSMEGAILDGKRIAESICNNA